MSAQFLNQQTKNSNAVLNNVIIDKLARPATVHNQQTTPTTPIDVNGSHTSIIQTQQLTTPHDNATQVHIKNVGETGRSSWDEGDVVKINLIAYSGYNGMPVISGFKDSDSGDYIINIGNVVLTGEPPSSYALNGLIKFSLEYVRFNINTL